MDIKVYEGWDGDEWNGGDVAVLKLNREADFTLPKWNNDSDALGQGLQLIALGWGKKGSSAAAPHELHKTKLLDYITFEQCEKIWLKETGRDPKQLPLGVLCAGGDDSDTCEGPTDLAVDLRWI